MAAMLSKLFFTAFVMASLTSMFLAMLNGCRFPWADEWKNRAAFVSDQGVLVSFFTGLMALVFWMWS